MKLLQILMRRTLVLLIVLAAGFTSTDAQIAAWRKIMSGEGESVGINPLNPHTIYTQDVNGKLNVSHDRGATWTVLPGSVPDQIREIIVHPRDTTVILVVAFFNGLYRSVNGGTTFSVVIPGFGIDGESVTYDPNHPDTMYAGNFADGSLYRSLDRGASWGLQGAIGTNLCALAVRPDSNNILLAGSGSGRISKSTDGGATWHLVKSAGSTEIPKIVINADTPRVAYATAFEGSASVTGVWKTTNGGDTWALTNLKGTSIWSLDVDQSSPSTVWAGSFNPGGPYTAGVYRSTDAGVSWQFITTGLPSSNSMWNIHIDPLQTSHVYLAATVGDFGNDGVYSFVGGNTGVQGFVRDSLTNNIIHSGSLVIRPSGLSWDLSLSNGGFAFAPDPGDTATVDTFLYVNSGTWKQQIVQLIPDSVLTQDILVRLGSIEGTVYFDSDQSGSRGITEPGLPGWLVQLTGPSPGSAISAGDGHFILAGLLPGSYSLTVQQQNGFQNTQPPGSTYSVPVSVSARIVTGKDFGEYLVPGVISVNPPADSRLNPPATAIAVTFDTVMNAASFNDTTSFIVLGSQSGMHRGAIGLGGGGTVATFTPVKPFFSGEEVHVRITKTAKTLSGVAVTPYAYQFTVMAKPGPLVFSGRTTYHTGHFPWSVTVGDLDNDGYVDVVTVNTNSNSVSVLKNAGGGTLLPPVDYAVGLTPQYLILADVDNDGDLDVITANSGVAAISVLKNNGDGTFAPRTDYPIPFSAWGVAAEDLDGDGYADIVAAGEASASVAKLINDGTGAFPSSTPYSGATGPVSVTIRDVNGDGAPDLVIINDTPTSTCTQLKNTGGGVFAPASTFSVGSNARYCALGDITGDGKADLVVANSGLNTFSLFPGTGSTFGAPSSTGTGALPWSVAAADMDGDSLLDVLVTNISSKSVSIFRNNGGGTFVRTDYPTGTNPHGVVAADLDNDGDMDLIVTEAGVDSVAVFINSVFTIQSHAAGWNLLSLPVRPEDNHKQSLYPAAASDAFGYQGSYETADTLAFGQGYWIKFAGLDSGLIRGSNVTSDSIPLLARWNLVGALSAPVAVTSVTTNPPGILTSSFYSYNGGYAIADSLRRGKGYWIKSSAVGKMALSSSAIQPLAHAAGGFTPSAGGRSHDGPAAIGIAEGLSMIEASNRLEFSDGASGRQNLLFTESAPLDRDYSFFAAPPPPPSSGLSVRFASERVLEAVSPSTAVALQVRTAGVQYPLSISWSMKGTSAYAWRLESGNLSQPLSGEGKIVLSRPLTGGFTLAGSPVQADMPDAFALRQNYPNPFNPETRIGLDIRDESLVTLKIYDVLGQEVGTIVNGKLQAGRYEVSWDASAQPSGVYYARMQAHGTNGGSPDFIQVRKMLLVR